jgi:hypothetical protein
MTQPAPEQEIPNIRAAVSPVLDDPSGVPTVLLRLSTGALDVTFRMDARKAPQFMANVTNGVIQAAQQALAAAGPQILVPTSPLIIPGMGQSAPQNGGRQ